MYTKIIILDDDPLLSLMYHVFFKDIPNIVVDIVNSPAIFWSLVAKKDFELAFLDIELGDPHEDGLDILGKLGLIIPDLPVVMMSSRDDQETVARCFKLGALTFQPKNSGFIMKLKEIFEGYQVAKLKSA